MAVTVNSHQHFWSLADPFFCWPTPDLGSIYRDFGPSELRPHLEAADVSCTVLVQVAPVTAETDRLLDIASGTDFVGGVVGWIDLEGDGWYRRTGTFLCKTEIRRYPPTLQSIPDASSMLQPNLSAGLDAIDQLGLTFDALVQPRHLDELCAFADRYAGLRIVVDHGAKPAIRDGKAGFDVWAPKIANCLAKRSNVWCKLSGLLTEAGSRKGVGDLSPYLDHMLRIFGPERLMWGSDWPVVELAGTYEIWIDMARASLDHLSDHERELIFGKVAQEFYRLSPREGR